MAAREVDVIVVGAGISGLTAAHILHKKDPNLEVALLEAKDRVGGRTLTVEMKSKDGTDSWDLGGQWVGSCQPHIMVLLEELKIDVYPQYTSGKKYMQVGRAHTISSYMSDIPKMSIIGLIDLHRLMKQTNKLSSEIDPNDPYTCAKAELWDAVTLENFVDSKIWSSDVKDVMRAAMRTMFGAELSQISLLFFLTYVASAGGEIKHLIEATQGTAQQYKIKGGAQHVSERLMQEVGSTRLILGEPISAIHQNHDGVVVTSKSGSVYKCKKIILAIPPAQIRKIDFTPTLPVDHREIVKRMPPSNIIKFIVTFSECFWREDGCSGEVVTSGGASIAQGCDVGPGSVVYDATSINSQPALLGFIGGKQAVQWQQQFEESRRSAVLKFLADFFGEKVYAYIEYREKIWDLEPYNEGGPVSVVAPGAMRYYATGLRKSCDRIHFAGTESASVWCGFMDGAVQAGHRAAIEVLYDLRPQLVDASDLPKQGQRGLKKRRSSKRRKLVKWTIGVSVCVVIAMSVKKMFHSSTAAS